MAIKVLMGDELSMLDVAIAPLLCGSTTTHPDGQGCSALMKYAEGCSPARDSLMR